MAANTDNVRAGITGNVRVAPLGTTAPTTLAPFAAGWSDLGYVSDNGVVQSNNADTVEIPSWQQGTIVRRYISGSSTTWAFTCLETKFETVSLYYPGSTFTTAAGITTVTVRNPTNDPRAFAIDVIDGEVAPGSPRILRWLIAKGELTDRGDVTFSNGDPVGWDMTITAYPDAGGTTMLLLTNDPAMAAPAAA
jgi:hypothetical protein